MVFTSRNWLVMQGPVAIILIPSTTPSHLKYFNYESKCQKHSYVTHWQKIFWHFCWIPYLYTFSLYENASFIIVSAETEYTSTRSWYRNINFCPKVVAISDFWLTQKHISFIWTNQVTSHQSFIWETGYWTRAIKRFALFDLLKSLYSDTKILS
jgi:hypothetical protein